MFKVVNNSLAGVQVIARKDRECSEGKDATELNAIEIPAFYM